jgi:hypothetical protein
MSRCTGRRCIPESKFKHAEDPEGPFRYKSDQCARECAADSDLCKTCLGWKQKYDEGKKDKWHGYIHGAIPEESHVEGSEWNLKLRAKYAAKVAADAMGVAVSAPKAKKAAKKVMSALEEVKEAEKELEEARSNAVGALKAAEVSTNNVVAEVLRKSSSGSKHANRSTRKSSSPGRVALGMANMYFSSSPKKAKTARKARKPLSPGRVALGMANMYISSSPKVRKPRTARKTAKKSSRANLGMAELYSSSPKSARSPSIYRPASASGSPQGAAASRMAGYATPVASGSPQRRFMELPPMSTSLLGYSNAASMLAGPPPSYSPPPSSSSSPSSSGTPGSNLLLQ